MIARPGFARGIAPYHDESESAGLSRSAWAWEARMADMDNDGQPEALQATAAGGITLRDVGPWTASVFGRYFGPRPLIEDASVKSRSTTLFST